ncbi:MAG: hypothetical protein H0U74_12390 [Bradymonadaceae bacterium]|nr:hypothetical protein [Lujinxingiaceae bacterium]
MLPFAEQNAGGEANEEARIQAEVDVLRFRLRPFELVVELAAISSVLDFEEAQGMILLDPAPYLGLLPSRAGHIGLLEARGGPPIGLCLGEVWGAESWSGERLLELPSWLKGTLPVILRKACGYDNLKRIVWMLDLDRLRQAG